MRRDMVSIDVVSAILFRYFGFDGKQNRLLRQYAVSEYSAFCFYVSKKVGRHIGIFAGADEMGKRLRKRNMESMVDKTIYFQTNVKLIGQYLNDAPFTTPISQESPGRLGVYIGWRIVDSYMENNENISLE
ncbi:MAG: hypothetical protein QM751_06835 [Paludibacteraceae bacterium]